MSYAIVANEHFTEDQLLICIYMQKFKCYSGEMNFCIGWLFDDLNVNYRPTQQNIISALNELVDKEIIILLNDVGNINKNTRIKTRLPEYSGSFTKVQLNDVDKIFKIDADIRTKKTMLHLYVSIASKIDSKGYCYPSFDQLKQGLGTNSDNRISSNLEKLKQLNLIDYKNIGHVLINDQIQQGNNVYVLCNNENYKNNLRKGIENRKEQYEQIFKGKHSNAQRSIAQKWRHKLNKYHSGTITDAEYEELQELELKYYELIKNNRDLLDRRLREFVTLSEKT